SLRGFSYMKNNNPALPGDWAGLSIIWGQRLNALLAIHWRCGPNGMLRPEAAVPYPHNFWRSWL
ncbi:hypothetical protein DW089_10470, partial [Acidaminococcus sp. AM05-11]